MARVKAPSSSNSMRPKSRPPINPEAKEQQMISLAMDLVEQRLRDGTASAQETTHFLKLATAKYKYELEETKQRSKLNEAKISSLESAKRVEALYEDAIKAFKNYNGQGDENEYNDY